MDMIPAPSKSQDHPLLLRGDSVAVAPSKLSLASHNSVFPFDDLELLLIKPAAHSYSSLKDLLPSVASVNSTNSKTAGPVPDICIRNRLVKQAAQAYLRPMSSSSGSAGGNTFHRFWKRVAAFIDILCRNVVRVFDKTSPIVGIRSSGMQRSKMRLV